MSEEKASLITAVAKMQAILEAAKKLKKETATVGKAKEESETE